MSFLHLPPPRPANVGGNGRFTQLMRATEAARRERHNRVAAGDESAMLKLTPQAKGGGKGPRRGCAALGEHSQTDSERLLLLPHRFHLQ